MSVLGTPNDVLEKVQKIEEHTRELRDIMDFDHDRANGKEFKIDPKEGTFESITSNRARRDAWKVFNILDGSKRKLNIPNLDDNETGRDQINNTEHLVAGMIYEAERKAQLLPGLATNDILDSVSSIHSKMCLYRIVLGGSALRLMIVNDNEDERPELDLAVWNRRNTFWIPGKSGLMWVCYRREISKEQADEEYPGNKGSENDKGLVEVFDVWAIEKGKKANEGVLIGEEWASEQEHNLEYLPLRITGGQSYLAINRGLIDAASRMMSYRLTAAGKESAPARGFEFNGDLDPSPNDPGFFASVVKNGFLPLDTSKGHKIIELPEPKTNHINQLSAELNAELDAGFLSPIAFGQQGLSMTAYGVDILNKNTREVIYHFKRAIEQDYIWMAHEICRQYKINDFPEIETEGFDSKFSRFKTKVNPDKVLDNREFVCELVIDELIDRAAHSQMAINEMKAGILAPEDAIDIHKLADNPQRVLANIDRARAREVFGVALSDGIFELIDDYRKEKTVKAGFRLNQALNALMKMQVADQQGLQQGMGQMQTQPAMPPGRNMPSNTSRMPQSNIPAPIREAARNEVKSGGQ